MAAARIKGASERDLLRNRHAKKHAQGGPACFSISDGRRGARKATTEGRKAQQGERFSKRTEERAEGSEGRTNGRWSGGRQGGQTVERRTTQKQRRQTDARRTRRRTQSDLTLENDRCEIEIQIAQSKKRESIWLHWQDENFPKVSSCYFWKGRCCFSRCARITYAFRTRQQPSNAHWRCGSSREKRSAAVQSFITTSF